MTAETKIPKELPNHNQFTIMRGAGTQRALPTEKAVKSRENLDENVIYLKKGSALLMEATRHVQHTTLSYRLSREPLLSVRRTEPPASYSVTIEKSSGGWRHQECLRDFTSDRAKAEEFFRLLTQGMVYPEHLFDVFEDFMS